MNEAVPQSSARHRPDPARLARGAGESRGRDDTRRSLVGNLRFLERFFPRFGRFQQINQFDTITADVIVRLGLDHRATYELMITVPDEHAELVATAVGEPQDLFITMVADVVGEESSQRTAALIMAGARGIAGMASSGHLRVEKWGLDAAGLSGNLIGASTEVP